tara:strand:+ start:4634 stop:5221 length:588 start_codon:yes stop_codon:yes gene_type:complete
MKVTMGKYPTHRWYHNYLFWLSDKIADVRGKDWDHLRNDQKVSVHIDDFDTWSMDHTLAYIIEPMLKQLKLTKHGAPYVYPEDAPLELRPTKKELTAYTQKGDTDPKYFDRWDWVMDEMLFAFESKHNNWEEQFYSGDHDTHWIVHTEGKLKGRSQLVKGPNDTFEIDWEGHKAYQTRITNGFRLFGKYYENLWD